MRINVVLSFLSRVILIVSIALVIPLLWSIYLNDGMWLVFVKTILVFVSFGLFLLYFFPLKIERIKPVEGYFIVTCAWLVTVLLGTLWSAPKKVYTLGTVKNNVFYLT